MLDPAGLREVGPLLRRLDRNALEDRMVRPWAHDASDGHDAMTATVLAVNALAVFRLARLAAVDDLTAPLRRRLGAPWVIATVGDATVHGDRPESGFRYWVWRLVTCPWCVSVWIAGLVVALQAAWPEGWIYPAMVLAFSAVAGLLAERS
jgi:hypothetical protein